MTRKGHTLNKEKDSQVEIRGVSRIEITAIKHATEDPVKLVKVIERIIPRELRGKMVLEKQEYSGHHGNPITYYRVVFEDSDAARVLGEIMGKIEPTSLSLLRATIEQRIQGNNVLHIRLHKQYLLSGRFILWDGDESVKVTIRFRDRQSLRRMLSDKGISPTRY